MQPLAYRVRPRYFNDIIGQDHLVGENGIIKKMIDNNNLMSFILYGNPGSGKTTIAYIIKDIYKDKSYLFNASTDSKTDLKQILDNLMFNKNIILIIDEIHRMKKDVQDYLLPYLEEGKVTVIGLTTENPYRVINVAIRSRLHIYRINQIDKTDLKKLLIKVSVSEFNETLSDDIYDYIITASSLEIRSALNMLEIAFLINKDERNLDTIIKTIGIKNISVDQKGENYYDILSALIKSIRGSDVDAAIHYLARFLVCEDLNMITRRLMISAYEDISLGNPQVGPMVYAACMSALEVGLPEARIPLANAVILLATSPKSNSCYKAINEAIADLDTLKDMQIPPHILNKEIKGGAKYLYPHDYPSSFVKQQYMPNELFSKIYFNPKDNSKYERALKEYIKPIRQKLKER